MVTELVNPDSGPSVSAASIHRGPRSDRLPCPLLALLGAHHRLVYRVPDAHPVFVSCLPG